jgi:hypothetical protein
MAMFSKIQGRTKRAQKRLRANPGLVDFGNRFLQPVGNKGLSSTQESVLANLRDEGFACRPLSQCFGGDFELGALRAYVQNRREASALGTQKSFIRYFWGERESSLDLENPFVRLATHGWLLDVVNAYKGGWTLLSQQWVAQCVPTVPDAPRTRSQNWHRDPGKGEKRLLKVFLYLNDVGPDSGAFECIPGTHRTGPLGMALPYPHVRSFYPSEQTMAESGLLPRARKITGPAGTLIFCDTSAFHRGGRALSNPRMMFVAEYVSPASAHQRRVHPAPGLKNAARSLAPQTQYALGLRSGFGVELQPGSGLRFLPPLR